MDTAYEERARERRRIWTGGVVASGDEALAADLAFWHAATSSERLNAIWSMVEEAWVLEGAHGSPPRFSGSACGTRRLGS